MNYVLFNFNGQNSDLGEYLNKIGIKYKEYDLASEEDNKIFNRFYFPFIKESLMIDSHLEIIAPIVLLLEEGRIKEVIQDKKSLEIAVLKHQKTNTKIIPST